MENIFAYITLDEKNNEMMNFSLTKSKFRFSCKRCAALCCKLGGPMITKKDAELIESSGYRSPDFIEPLNSDFGASTNFIGYLKSKEDGSCIFLKFDNEHNQHHCEVYNLRPSLCRLYPFTFEKLKKNQYALKIIPCCNGLNSINSEPIDEKYVASHILKPLLDAIHLYQK